MVSPGAYSRDGPRCSRTAARDIPAENTLGGVALPGPPLSFRSRRGTCVDALPESASFVRLILFTRRALGTVLPPSSESL